MNDSLEPTQSAVGPVERALHLLICFHTHMDGVSLTELARMADLAPSTTTRLLKVLERYGFVRRGSDRLYRLGPQLIQLGLGALRDMSLYEIARPHLRSLAEETGESAHLGILVGESNVLYVDQVSSHHTVQTATWVGRSVPLADTAIGTAIQGKILPAGYTATRHTIEPDVSSVAAPIYDQNHEIIGAINIIGPTYRISDEQLTQFGILIADHARQISTRLGATYF
ncbi:IclR family transcriptional regulator [Dictyobacter arantiisoli]|uniref:IclR family transcriptional regulator n=1 Tax=Dictyobacter arantiisoli TaxID=2014874 RepID=A0A5A5TB43_9CHLR|nr:IclR family transcriptional regulator [Dictyobacter arantiisoli]GCF08465.1 IclR family transcriptional regulator [Dictyobacter arantiisoli]